MTDASSIPVGPIVQFLDPYIQMAAMALITAFVGWAATTYHRWTGKDMAAADQEKLQKAIDDAAGVIFAGAEAGISTQSIHVGDPRIVAQAGRIGAFMPAIVNGLGLNADSLAHMIAGALGKLQAQSSTANAAPAVADAKMASAPTVAAATQ
jgi:hypothetical protein